MTELLNYVYLTVNDTDVNGFPIQLELPFQPVLTDNNLYNINLINQENVGLIWNGNLNQNFALSSEGLKEEETPTINLIKSEEYVDESVISAAPGIESSLLNIPSGEPYIIAEPKKPQVQLLNLPESQSIRCQNCDTLFTTKYQYQRHQCEFNASKVVLKPEVKGEDIHTVIRAKYECETCKKTFISITNLERHKQSHISTGNNTCEHCNKTFVSESRLLTHKANHCKKSGEVTKFYRSDVAVWHCVQCDQVFSSEQNGDEHISNCVNAELQLHVKTEQAEQPEEKPAKLQVEYKPIRPNVQKIVTETLYQCEFCNRTYASKASVRNHQKLHTTEKNYECVFCASSFNSYSDAVIHWQNKCSDGADVFFLPKLVYCEYCDKGYKSHDVLYNHKNKKKHHSFKLHMPATELDKIVVKEELVAESAPLEEKPLAEVAPNGADAEPGKKRRGRKRKYPKLDLECRALPPGHRYQCPRCAFVFDEVQTLESHMEHEHANIYMCHLCGQVLNSPKALAVHSRAHQSLKPYVCDKCGRSYSQTSHLWQHMRFHQGIKPFACPHEGCEARYTIRPDLKDHIRKVHTRERPFRCSVCNKCFLTGSVYYQHRLIHTNDRRYGCEICNKRFFRADALNNHRRIHTDERPYICGICGRSFRQKGDRNKHVRTQHVTT